MPKQSEQKIEIYGVPQTWYGRLIAAIATVLLLWLAIIFFMAFLIIVGLLFALVIIRMIWPFSKAGKGQSSSFIETEYYVEKNEQTESQNAKHKIAR